MVMIADLDWTKLVEQAPAAACMLAVVFLFIKYLGTIDKRGEARDEAHAKLVKELGDSCHEHQLVMAKEAEKVFDGMRECVNKNTDAMKENTKALARAGH